MADEQTAPATDAQAQTAVAAPGSAAPPDVAPESEAPESVAPFDYDAALGTLRAMPRDVAARLLDEVEPLKAERDTHAQRAQAKAAERLRKEWEAERAEQARREAESAQMRAEREAQKALIARAREGDFDARDELLNSIFGQYDRAALKAELLDDPETQRMVQERTAAALVAEVVAHPLYGSLSETDRRRVLQQPSLTALLQEWVAVHTADKITKSEADALIEAARVAERDKLRPGQPAPDTGTNAVAGRRPDRLTRADLARMTQQERLANVAAIREQWGDLARARE